MTFVTERIALRAIDTITKETGYPPYPDEVAHALNATTKQIHSALIRAKRAGRVRYDAEYRFVLVTEAAE